MSGSIFVLDQNDNISELRETKYKSEDIFQSLIEQYPGILAGDQISPEEPRQWIFISREMGVPSELGGGSRWYLDHLFLDQDAIPTFIEVKRSSDTRLRREVVAQMLDYAANATSYWTGDNIRELYENAGTDRLAELGIINENDYWESVNTNLNIGKIRLMFVADEIPVSLMNIIEFLNNQMIHTEVLGLEIKQFEGDSTIKTFVPRIIGATSIATSVKNRSSKKWDEDSFLDEIEQVGGSDSANKCRSIISSLRELNCRICGEKVKNIRVLLLFMMVMKVINYLVFILPARVLKLRSNSCI